MDQTLSVVLPVHNAEATLARQVNELLEILPELTSKFEVLIVDDGSTDHTLESARELAREYPQLRVARHAEQQGIPAVVKTGLEQASGDIVYIQDEAAPVQCGDLRKLWSLRTGSSITKAASLDAGLIGRLLVWDTSTKTRLRPASSAIRMLQRTAKRTECSRTW